jgi:hypothetical protein
MNMHPPMHIHMTSITTYVTFLIRTIVKSTMLHFNADPNSTRISGLGSPPDAQTTWDLLSSEAKHIILEHKNQRPPARTAQLHDFTMDDHNAMTARELIEIQMHDTRMGREGDDLTTNNSSSQN